MAGGGPETGASGSGVGPHPRRERELEVRANERRERRVSMVSSCNRSAAQIGLNVLPAGCIPGALGCTFARGDPQAPAPGPVGACGWRSRFVYAAHSPANCSACLSTVSVAFS